MPDKQPKKAKAQPKQGRFNARLSLDVIDAIYTLQHQHWRKTRKHKSRSEIVDEAVRAYAKQQGIKVED